MIDLQSLPDLENLIRIRQKKSSNSDTAIRGF